MEIKVEILLPLFYNPDERGERKQVEGEKYSETFDQIAAKFTDYTVDNSPLLGKWINPKTKKKIEDENTSCWVICEGSDENIQFFKDLKEIMKQRFLQDDILIYHISIYRY